jgi:hypothetical protein
MTAAADAAAAAATAAATAPLRLPLAAAACCCRGDAKADAVLRQHLQQPFDLARVKIQERKHNT